MNPRRDLHTALSDIDRGASDLPREARDELADFLSAIADYLILTSVPPSAKARRFSTMRTTLSRVLIRNSPKHLDDVSTQLRELRALLLRGRPIDDMELQRGMEHFWNLLRITSDDWEPQELSRLLSYAMRIPDPFDDYSRKRRSNQIVVHFKQQFRKLPPLVRHQVARELLLRVLSEKPHLLRDLARRKASL